MRTSSLCAALLASVAGAVNAASHPSSRPNIIPSPKQPRLPVPSPPVRTKSCTVQTHGDGSDDSAYILSAFRQCNNGGRVLFLPNTTYTVGTAMDWTFLRHIDIGMLCFFRGVDLLGPTVSCRALRAPCDWTHTKSRRQDAMVPSLCSSGRVPAVIGSVLQPWNVERCTPQGDKALMENQQISKGPSSSQTTPIIGRQTLSHSSFKTSPVSSSWEEMTSSSTEVGSYFFLNCF